MSNAPTRGDARASAPRGETTAIADDDAADERCVAYAALGDGDDAVPCAEFRVTCPDKTGLGADICRVVFEFGLVVTRGDFTTDGVWALVLLTVRAGALDRGANHGSLMDENAEREGAGGGGEGGGRWWVVGRARRVARRRRRDRERRRRARRRLGRGAGEMGARGRCGECEWG